MLNPAATSEVEIVSESGSTATYGVILEDGYTILEPRGKGTYADSRTPKDSYAYSHGGGLYRAAVDRAKEIQEAR